jgi:Tfp pilus assembly protein PilV
MRPDPRAPSVQTRIREGGFSLVEAAIAAAILLIIALGLIPLFTRSMLDNSSGNDSTQASNHGKTRLEELIQLPFNHQSLAVTAGQPFSQTTESWTQGSVDELGDPLEGWAPGVPAGRGQILWQRVTRVSQYSISDLDDGVLDDPQPGGTQPNFIHLKQIEVVLDSQRSSVIGGGRDLTLRVIKPF